MYHAVGSAIRIDGWLRRILRRASGDRDVILKTAYLFISLLSCSLSAGNPTRRPWNMG